MGVNILTRNSPPSSGAAINTGALFLAGPMNIGGDAQNTPVQCHSIADFEAAFAARSVANAVPVWDYLDGFFREGGNSAYVLDYGPNPTGTTVGTALTTGAPITSISVAAITGIAWPVGTLVLLKSGANSQVFTLTAPAASGATTLSVSSQTPNFAYPVGTTATPFLTANGLSNFGSMLGPGQVGLVGESPNLAVYTAVQQHVDGNGRIGLLDVASSDNTAALMQAEGTIAQSLSSLGNIGLFGSWANIPAPAGVIGGTTRTIPASAIIAALCNRVDSAIGSNGIANYNQPAGGRSFPLQYAQGFVFDPVLASDQSALQAKGVNFFHTTFGGTLENYGFVTPMYQGTPLTTTPFWQLNCSRALMWLKAQAAVVGENYYMKDIDSDGVLAASLQADLMALCRLLYDAGALYGDLPGGASPAYDVQVGVGVNTTANAAQGVLNANLQARFAQYAQAVNITLVSVPVLGVVS